MCMSSQNGHSTGGLFTKVNFNGYEDTTERDDNQVKGAEHWFTSSVLPKVLIVTYDCFLHRVESASINCCCDNVAVLS